MRRVGGYIALSVMGVAVAALVLLFTLDLRPLAKRLDQHLGDQLGHQISFDGALGLDIDIDGIWFVFNGLKINSQESLDLGVRPISGRIEQLRVHVDEWALLNREIHFREIKIQGGDLSLIVNRSPLVAGNPIGRSVAIQNQRFELGGLNTVSASDTRLNFVDAGISLFEITLGSARAHPGEIGLNLEADGLVRGQPVAFQGQSGPLMAILSGHKVFLDGALQSASAKLNMTGTVGDLATLGVDIVAEGDATELNDVALLLGFKNLEKNTPTTITASIKGNREHLVLEDIQAGFGRGDLSGRVEIRQGDSFNIVGDLKSDLLDMDALEGVSWTSPPTRIFSNGPLPTDWLRSGTIDISYVADNVIFADALLNDGRVRVSLSGGVLSVNPIEVRFLDGSFDSLFMVDARGFPYFKSEANLKNFDLGRLLSEVDMMGVFEAILDFGMQIEGEGDSIASMLANSKGQTNLVMGPGKLSERAVRLLGGDLADTLRPMTADASENSETFLELRCAVSRFDIDRGVAKSRAFLIQTENTITTGRGVVNLGTESLNLRLAPRPKNPARLEHAADLRVSGSFMQPVFDVQTDKLSRGIAGSLGRFALIREKDIELLPLLDERSTEFNACISAFSGANDGRRGLTSIYDEPQDFDFRRATKRK